LRVLKRDNADDKIDKQLVTNVFLQFLSKQRGDATKYEVLQLIASVLTWNDGWLSCHMGQAEMLIDIPRATRKSWSPAARHGNTCRAPTA